MCVTNGALHWMDLHGLVLQGMRSPMRGEMEKKTNRSQFSVPPTPANEGTSANRHNLHPGKNSMESAKQQQGLQKKQRLEWTAQFNCKKGGV